jgi:hypothetical protein
LKYRVWETSTSHVDVEVEDGLEGDALDAAIEQARVSTAIRVFDSVDSVDWEPI